MCRSWTWLKMFHLSKMEEHVVHGFEYSGFSKGFASSGGSHDLDDSRGQPIFSYLFMICLSSWVKWHILAKLRAWDSVTCCMFYVVKMLISLLNSDSSLLFLNLMQLQSTDILIFYSRGLRIITDPTWLPISCQIWFLSPLIRLVLIWSIIPF